MINVSCLLCNEKKCFLHLKYKQKLIFQIFHFHLVIQMASSYRFSWLLAYFNSVVKFLWTVTHGMISAVQTFALTSSHLCYNCYIVPVPAVKEVTVLKFYVWVVTHLKGTRSVWDVILSYSCYKWSKDAAPARLAYRSPELYLTADCCNYNPIYNDFPF